MSILEVKLNKSLSDDWQVARAVFEGYHKVVEKAVYFKRIRTSTQDEFEAHLLDVHRRCCDACPPGGRRGVRQDRDAHGSGAAHNPHKQTIYVSTSTQTTYEHGMHGLKVDALHMLDDRAVNDKDKDISHTSALLSTTTCHGGDYEAPADVNRSPEKSSNKRVASTKFIKVEALADDPLAEKLPDQGIKQEDHDNESIREEERAMEQREDNAMDGLLEEGRPSSLEDQILDNHKLLADVASYFEKTNQVLGRTIKDEQDRQYHVDDVDMANESTSHERLIKEEIPTDGSDVQSHLERADQTSDQPIRHETNSQDVDMESSMNEATSHQRLEEKDASQNITSDVQSPVERTNQATDQPMKQRDPQDGCMDSSRNEATSHQRLAEDMSTDGSDGEAILEGNSEPSNPTCNRDGHCYKGKSSEQSHADGKTIQDTNMRTCSIDNCDVHSQDDSCQDLCHADTKTILENTCVSPGSTHTCHESDTPALCRAGMDSYKKIQNTSGSKGKKTFQCSDCHKIYSYRSAFRKHLSTHTCHQKGYSECKHRSSQKYNLCMLIRTQRGNEPYQCIICNKSSARHDHLAEHIRRHLGEKPYKCTSCKKSFCNQSSLNRHVLIHSEGKSFNCSICDKVFTRKDNLDSHCKKQHPS